MEIWKRIVIALVALGALIAIAALAWIVSGRVQSH